MSIFFCPSLSTVVMAALKSLLIPISGHLGVISDDCLLSSEGSHIFLFFHVLHNWGLYHVNVWMWMWWCEDSEICYQFFEEPWFICYSRQLIWLYSNWELSLGWQLKSQFSSLTVSCVCSTHACYRDQVKICIVFIHRFGSFPCLSLSFPSLSFPVAMVALKSVCWISIPKKTVFVLLELATPNDINFIMPSV